MTKHTEVMKLALEALEAKGDAWIVLERKAKAAIREALAEQPAQQQEPVAWALSHSRGIEFNSKYPMQSSRDEADRMALQHLGAVTVTPLYTTPQAQRPSRSDIKPLTDELNQIEKDLSFHGLTLVKTATGYAVLKLGQITAHSKGDA